MPENVVHLLEPVEVEAEHRGRVAVAAGVHQGLVQALGQEDAVGEVRQRVVQGEVAGTALRAGKVPGHLAERGDEPADLVARAGWRDVHRLARGDPRRRLRELRDRPEHRAGDDLAGGEQQERHQDNGEHE
jgi:hypothetical protein